ncbi:putative transmembrane transport, partial [Operophtera brumata]
MIYLPSVVAVGYYFESRRSLATGIAVCGSGVGTFSFAPLAAILLKEFGSWQNANLLLAGLILNCAVFGALMRPLAPLNIDPGVHSSLNLEALARVPTVPNMPGVHPVPTLPTITEAKVADESGDKKRKTENGNGNVIVNPTQQHMSRNVSSPAFSSQAPGLPKNGSVPFFDRQRKQSTGDRSALFRFSAGDAESQMYTSKMSVSGPKEPSRMVRPMSRKDIFYSGSVLNLPQYQSQKSLQGYRNSVLSLPQSRAATGDLERPEQYDLCPCLSLPASFKSALSSMLDVSLLRDPAFMLIGVSNVFGMAGLYVPFVYIVDAAMLNVITSARLVQVRAVFNANVSLLRDPAFMLIGVSNVFGMAGLYVPFVYIVDAAMLNVITSARLVQVRAVFNANVSLLRDPAFMLIGVSNVFGMAGLYVPFVYIVDAAMLNGVEASQASFLLSIIGITNTFGPGYISLTSIILVDLLGLDKLTNAFGLLILFRGAAAIVGSPLAGAVYDATKNYDASFYMASAFFLAATLTSFAAPLFRRKPEEIVHPTDVLTPIDEDLEEGDEDDDDTPITMGAHIATRPPAITHTAASPSEPDSPSPPEERAQRESVL